MFESTASLPTLWSPLPYDLLDWVISAFPEPSDGFDISANDNTELPALFDPATYEYDYMRSEDDYARTQ